MPAFCVTLETSSTCCHVYNQTNPNWGKCYKIDVFSWLEWVVHFGHNYLGNDVLVCTSYQGVRELTFLFTVMTPWSLGCMVSAGFLICKITMFPIVISVLEESLWNSANPTSPHSPPLMSASTMILLAIVTTVGFAQRRFSLFFFPSTFIGTHWNSTQGLSLFPTRIYLIYISMDLQTLVLFHGLKFGTFIVLWLLLFQLGANRSFFRLTPVFLLPLSSLSQSGNHLPKSPLNIDWFCNLKETTCSFTTGGLI